MNAAGPGPDKNFHLDLSNPVGSPIEDGGARRRSSRRARCGSRPRSPRQRRHQTDAGGAGAGRRRGRRHGQKRRRRPDRRRRGSRTTASAAWPSTAPTARSAPPSSTKSSATRRTRPGPASRPRRGCTKGAGGKVQGGALMRAGRRLAEHRSHEPDRTQKQALPRTRLWHGDLGGPLGCFADGVALPAGI